jgi:hypothetical protein
MPCLQFGNISIIEMIPIAYPFFLEIFKLGKSEPSPPEEFKKYQEMIPALKSFPIEYLVPS